MIDLRNGQIINFVAGHWQRYFINGTPRDYNVGQMEFTEHFAMFGKCFCITVVPVTNGHPRDQAKVSVHCRWPPIRGNLTLKCVGRGIDNVAVQGRWPLTTGVA